MTDQERLRSIQLTQLEIMRAINEICERRRISYFLCAGTTLGAVRHRGFIPWDDDLDIMVPRPDYIKMLKYLQEELPDEYWLQTYDTDPHYWQPFAKVRKKNTVYKEKGMENIDDSKCGIWVDIFPMDTASKKQSMGLRTRRYWVKLISFVLRAREFHYSNKAFSRRYVLPMAILRRFPSSFLKRIQEHIMMIQTGKHKYYVNLASTYEIDKETYPKEWFQEQIQTAFEDAVLPIPNGYEGYLRQLYGDYMVLPPENKRKGHNVSDFCKIVI